ncbi:G2 and S phase-expressed protein 1 isoform X1 [Dasypus novemcinctus]|uniref:G2 and S phase-expressed protein 1 isoform X1 n=1 Tax=Dasypus novemcinctus TaxID=9361 RepID=UPI00265E9121|nr:G2 and S phase-expressed protein 1 isoform X1 [Dasypus novemcinctus]XP_058164924.1 G2 and S phase-expressed protein 1 isoform X1 [Dasypus novemcinctus]
MDAHRKNDILLLADEKFDFDLSLSSSSANEDDEVFFGPVGHKERCIATGLELNNQIPEEPRLPASWSPLTGEKFVEVYKEAHLLALQIESNSRNKAAKAPKPEEPWGQGMENFVLESQLKINLFKKENELKKSPNSLKRETYYLSASPLAGPLLSGSALLPASQPALRGPGTQAELSEAQQPLLCAGPCGAAAEKKTGSKLQPPRASSTGGKAVHLAAEKPKKEIPVSSSRMKTLNDKEAHKDVLPDKSRATLDAVSLPASESLLVQGKRPLPVPSKLGLKKTLLKPPGCAGNLARKPLSSGPAASTARGSGVSPATGKATVSGLVNIPAHSSRPLSESSKPSGLGPAVQRLPLQSGPVDASCKQTKAAAVPERTGVQPEEPTTALPQPQTPEHRAPRLNSSSSVSKSSQLNKLGSIRRRDSCLNSKMKVMPTPTNQFKIPKFSVGESPDNATPKLSRAQRPQSCCSVERVVHSTPVRRPSGPAPPNFLSSAGTPMSTKRGSALPTPASRRLSGLPFMTPNTRPRALGSPLGMPARRLSSEPRKKSAVRTEPTKESNTNVVSRQSDLPSVPSISPPSVVPQALNFSPEKSDFLFLKTITTEATLNEAKATEETSPNEALLVDIKLDQLTIAPEAGGAPHVDFPLIDLCSTPEATGEQLLLKPSVAWGSESKPLIDLMINTPDINKNVASKPFQEVGQLIDLGSPLIQLSPEADKENVDSPLLKF